MRLRGVFRAAKLPNGQRAIGTKWGFRQKYGIDYTDTFSPVIKYVTLRTVIAISRHFGWPIDQLGVVTAFLYGIIKEQVFYVIPEGVGLDSAFDCLELVKSIYGLKQASRVWNEMFDEFLCFIGFRVSDFDPCLYIKTSDGHCVFVLVYVDDVLTAANVHLFLGSSFLDGEDGSVTLCQRRYVDDILKRFGMEECKAVASPVDVSSRLMSSNTASKIDVPFVKRISKKNTELRSSASFATYKAPRCMEFATSQVQGSTFVAIRTQTGPATLLIASQCLATFMLLGAPVSWGSKKQPTVSLSTSQAEYIALSLAIQEGKWNYRLPCEIMAAANEDGPELTIRKDNQSCIKMTKNPVNHGRAKYIDIKYHHICDEVKRGEVKLGYCETKVMLADIMTKGLHGPRHKDLTAALGICARLD
uniref:Reverse transcriptase Ty1/copia-type domain-containing protein n=1 Tax=Peronospora matthiolae TaxID=2874970 RepID=A0AAV1VG97_9STRA